MISPAKRHYMRAMAAQESAAAAASDNNPHGDTYDLMQAKLFEDSRRLKALESVKAKEQLKAELLPDYEPYIKGILEADSGNHDDILMTVMLWHIDAGNYADALDIGDYALRHQLPMPDKYQRSTACLIAEEIAEASLKGPGMAMDLLLRVESLTEGHDMPDQVRAKLHKALGQSLAETKPDCALRHLKQALALDQRSGVKTEIKKLEKQLKTSADSTAGNPGGESS